MAYQSINPATGQLIDNFDSISDHDLNLKMERAEISFRNWSRTSFDKRKKLLLNVAEELDQNTDKHAEIITTEMGKPITQAIAEVKKCAWVCRYYAEKGEEFLKPVKIESAAKESWVLFQPQGVIFAVMPWNFPYWQVFRFIAPNVAAGNTGLLKHASNVPRCALAIEEAFLIAGGEEGIFQNLFIDYKQTETVLKCKAVQGVTLTGSNYAGYRIAELAGKAGKKTVLELGGSDPYVVFAGADLNNAVETSIMARFQNNGQSCIAAKRFFIEDSIYEPFMDKLIPVVESIQTGDPMDPGTLLGPVAREDLMIELESQLERMKQAGAQILTGGKRKIPGTLYLEPTIVHGLPNHSPVMQEEIFGPILPVFKFNTEEEAIRLANDTPFGLGASVWTSNMQQAKRVAAGIETGTVSINGMVKSDPGLPFGGVKASGYGRELSEYGFREFLNIKTVSYF